MRQRARVLAIDDDHGMLELLQFILSRESFDVFVAHDALSGICAAQQTHPDAILLDVMMPGADGFEACRRLRQITDAPIIFITAKASADDISLGLSLGADDYLVKPFSGPELIARLTACLRREGKQDDVQNRFLSPAASILLDCGRREVIIGNRTVSLTPKEFNVLRLLMRHAGKVLSNDAILARAWGPEWIGERDLVKQYIYQLRQKIEPHSDPPRHLRTASGEGYYFEADDLL